jgi:hypothetical protein
MRIGVVQGYVSGLHEGHEGRTEGTTGNGKSESDLTEKA